MQTYIALLHRALTCFSRFDAKFSFLSCNRNVYISKYHAASTVLHTVTYMIRRISSSSFYFSVEIASPPDWRWKKEKRIVQRSNQRKEAQAPNARDTRPSYYIHLFGSVGFNSRHVRVCICFCFHFDLFARLTHASLDRQLQTLYNLSKSTRRLTLCERRLTSQTQK